MPTGAKPINTWTDKDEAFADVAAGIRRAIEGFARSGVSPSVTNETVRKSLTKHIVLGSTDVTIGRALDNTHVINDSQVSGHHAVIRLHGQGYAIFDLKSTNRTFVNGQPLLPETAHMLRQGDSIRVGKMTFEYSNNTLVIPIAATPAPKTPLAATAQAGTGPTPKNLPQQELSGSSTGRLPPGRILNQRYRLLDTVGQGGMGVVYLAQDTRVGDRHVAVKEMSMSRLGPQDRPRAVEQFQREANLLGSLHHPNLPAIHDHFGEKDRWYLVMSFIGGQNLQAVLNAAPEKRLPLNEVVRIGIELCGVLDYLHTYKPPVIFRDLKPLNIMVTPKGHIFLIDFGIARHFNQEQAKDTASYYSRGYSPPEQYGQSQTGPRSDIYSLGVTLHQMLSGHNPASKPFQFPNLQLMDQTLPVPLAKLIMQMLEINEQARPASAAEVKAQLERVLVPQQITLQPSPLDKVIPPSKGELPAPSTGQGDVLYNQQRYEEALEAYEQAIRLDPNNAKAYTGKGNVLYNLERYDEALEAYDQAIRLDPNDASAYIGKGGLLDDIQLYGDALEAYERAIRLDSNNARACIGKGDVLDSLQRYDEALAAYDEAIRLDPNNATVYINKGVALHSLQRYDEALAAYDEAIRLDRNKALTYSNKGALLGDLQRYEEALEAYDQASRLDFTNATVYINKGDILENLLRYGEALVAYEQAILLDTDDASAYTGKGDVLGNLHRDSEALVAYEQAIRLDPNDASGYIGKGNVLYRLERYEEAVVAYDQAIRLDPNNVLAHIGAGDLLDDIQLYGEALAAYEQAIRLDPNDASSYQKKGDVLGKLQRYSEALTAYDQAVRLDPNNAEAYISAGDVLGELHRYGEALTAYGQAVRLDPNNAEAYISAGDVLGKLQRYDEALAAYEQAIRLDPNDARAYTGKGDTLKSLQRYNEARVAYEQAIRLDPDNVPIPSQPAITKGTPSRSMSGKKISYRLKKIIVNQLGVDESEVVPHASFVEDLDADANDLVELIMSMEEEFRLQISDEDAERIVTVQDAEDYIQEHLR